MAETAVVVLVPEAEQALGQVYWDHTRSGAEGLPPHVTLLIPFADSETLPLNGVREVLGGFEPFAFRLTGFRRFGRVNVVLWAAPEPAEPFVAVTAALVRRFPRFRPYGGAFEEVVPHLTVAIDRDPAVLDRLERELGPALPVAARAETATIVYRAEGGWLTHTTIPLGG